MNIVLSDSTTLKCIVVDDESMAIKGLLNYISKVNFLEVVATCSSAVQAGELLKKEEIDLMFLDINMPFLSGLDFLESLLMTPLTIITTAFSEYALEGYRLHVIDYLMKPFSFKRFYQAVLKAQDTYNSQLLIKNSSEGNRTEDIYIRQGTTYHRINFDEILFVEGMQNYVKIHVSNNKAYISHQTMNSIEEALPTNAFFRIHRSYLVNTSYIESINGNRIIINNSELTISKDRKDEFLNNVVFKKLLNK